MDAKKAIAVLNFQIEESKKLSGHVGWAAEVKKWQRDTEIAIEKIFGEGTRHLKDFKKIHYSSNIMIGGMDDRIHQQDCAEGLIEAQQILQSMVEEISNMG